MRLDKYYEKATRRYSERPAIKFRDETITYAELDDSSARLANIFRSIGLRPQDHVGILMANRPEFLITEIATARAGIVSVPMNSQLKKEGIRSILDDAKIRTLIVGPQFLQTAQELQQELLELNYIIGICDDQELPIGFHDFSDLLQREDPDPPSISFDPDETASLFYTGGTTGPQKGVMHTSKSLILNAYAHINELEILRNERVLLHTPLSHTANFVARAALAQGATLTLHQEFESSRTLQTIEDEDITWTFLIPTMISRLLNDFERTETDVSSLDTIAYGASSMPPALVKEGIEKLGNVFIQFYGLMEAPDVVTMLSKSKHDPEQPAVLNTVGYPTQLAEVKIIDDADRWDDDIGEIAVKSSFSMKGYFKHKSENGNWIRTGDLGRFDEKGRLLVLDRIQDTIESKGHLVFSTSVENVIQRHPAVHQVAVIGVPTEHEPVRQKSPINHHYVDQKVKAVISITEGKDVTLEEIQKFCADKLDDHEIPSSIDSVGQLPETPYGKVNKQILREPYW
jgi:fatty-acyl-CoA synthase